MLGSLIVKVAIAHYWLLGMRGGEKIVEQICQLFPQADIFTLFYDPDSVSETIRRHRVTASYLNPLRRYYRSLLPLMPAALESLDLRGYDLVISSESGPAKGVLTDARACHVCYCHTPMRYLWELYPAYVNDWTRSSLKRWLMRPLATRLRVWDYATAARVDHFAANSYNVQRRIWKTYRREARVIHPPVAVDRFYHGTSEGYFLAVSELVAYKQLDYAVRLFARRGLRFKVVGQGPEFRNLQRLGGSTTEFCGRVPQEQLRDLYAHARAFLLPGEEDFGIAAVEALASGKPVIALARGGALETVPETGGVRYAEPQEASLDAALAEFEAKEASFDPASLQSWSRQFSETAFRENMRKFVNESMG